MRSVLLVGALLLLGLVTVPFASAQGNLGVCYGLYNKGMNHSTALGIIRNNSWTRIKTYWSDAEWLDTVRRLWATTTTPTVTIALANYELQRAALNTDGYIDKLMNTTRTYSDIVRYIAVGNEPFAAWNREEAMPWLLQAHNRIVDALRANGLASTVKVLVPWSAEVIIDTYPVSTSRVEPNILATMQSILTYVRESGSAFEINLYPWFAYVNNYPRTSLDYALGNRGYNITGSQLVSMIEATKVALNKINFGDVRIIIGETGWPTGGSRHASYARAQTYLYHLRNTATATGTDIYIFSVFDEPNKPQGADNPVEYHFGFMTNDGQAKFDLSVPGPDDPDQEEKNNNAAIIGGVVGGVGGLLLLAAAVVAYLYFKRKTAAVEPSTGKDAGSTADGDVEAIKPPGAEQGAVPPATK